ncbi:RES family NAD+ phosphorylase [Pinisolibacter sp.]|uniref:RES family NAD+ phosphorylase n=1 Tax=Pinisolibacter sp. TaxID=2172024 RepID=UPI002FDC90A1
MRLYRIGSSLYPLFDGTGAMLHGGRWNSAGSRAIYCASSLAAAQLETLVHVGRASPPTNHTRISIEVPDDIAVTTIERHALPPGWDHPTATDVSQSIGDDWFSSGRTAILRVPSVAAAEDHVWVINQDHPDFARMTASPPQPLVWDPRLF